MSFSLILETIAKYQFPSPSCGSLKILMATSENSSSFDCCTASAEMNRDKNGDQFSMDEEALVLRMYNLVGERWALIAGRIPGRTPEEIKKYWGSRRQRNCLGK